MATAVLLGGLAAASAHSQNVEEQVITGTILRGNVTAVSPIQTIDGIDLQESPQITLNDYFVTYFTPNASVNTDLQTQASGGSGLRGDRGTSLDLRGLGSENTLILINGVRTVDYSAPDDDGWRSVDINGTIPTIAVRRTDVLLDGGSAIYGTDAVAGVVNLIPNYGYRGTKISVNGSADENDWGYVDYNMGIMWGGGNDDTNIILAYEKAATNPAAIGQSNNADRGGNWSNPQPGDEIYDGANTAPEHNWYAAAPGIVENTYTAYLYPQDWDPQDPNYPAGATGPLSYVQWSRDTFSAIYDPDNWPYASDYQEWASGIRSSTRCPTNPNASLPNGYIYPGVFQSSSGEQYVSTFCGNVVERIIDWGTSPETVFVDPLCGRADVFGREQIFVGNTRDQFVDEYVDENGDEVGLAATDAYGCLWYDRPGRLEIENTFELDNQVALVALEHRFSDSLRWAGEVSWSENKTVDYREYFPDTDRSIQLLDDAGLSYQEIADPDFPAVFQGIDLNGNVVNTVSVPDWVVEWDHPGIEFNRDLWDQFCSDPDEYCHGNGQNPWDPDNWDEDVPGVFAGEYNAYPFDNHSTRINTAEMYRFGNSLTWQINDDWSALFGGVIAQHEVVNELDDMVPERLALALKGLGGPNCGVTIDEYAADPDGFESQKGQGECSYWNPYMNAMHPDAADYNATNDFAVQRWITGPATSVYTSDFWSVNGSASGVLEFVDVGSGPLAVALGAEYRSDELSVDFDTLQEQARYIEIQDSDIYTDFSGKTETYAALIDTSMPLTDALTMQVALRSEVTKAGKLDFDSTTYKVGFNWQATDGLTLRAAYGTSFRAPTVSHLFGRLGRAPTTVDLWEDPALDLYRQEVGPGDYDPSDDSFNDALNGGVDRDIRREAVTTVLAPNPNLLPQEGDAFSIGLTWDLTDNLRLTLGYVDITFENAINSADVQYAKAVCAEQATYTDYGNEDEPTYTWYQPTFDGRDSESCFGLDENGNVDKYYDTFYNVGQENSRALDIGIDYRVMTAIGEIGIRPNGTINLERSIKDLSTNNLVVDTVASDVTGVSGSGIPEYRFNLPVSWEWGRHRATVTGRWTSAIKDYSLCLDMDGCVLRRDFDGDGVDVDVAVNYGGTLVTDTSANDSDYITADFRYSYQITDAISIAATVTNIVNTLPARNGTIFPNDIRRFGLQFNMDLGGE